MVFGRSLILIVLVFVIVGSGLRVTRVGSYEHLHVRELNVRNCLQELNKVVANFNGTFVSGEGYLSSCRNANVFSGSRFGVILTANCPDL